MTLPDLHLSEDALAAYVDRTLSPTADDRAARHLRSCAECRSAVDVEREAKALLGAAPDPSLPAGLMARLLDVPMTADLGGTDQVLAIDGDRLGWSTGSTNSDTRVVERRAAAPARPRPQVRPAGPARPAGRSARARRTRRGLAVSLAGLAFGVIASAASAGAGGGRRDRQGRRRARPVEHPAGGRQHRSDGRHPRVPGPPPGGRRRRADRGHGLPARPLIHPPPPVIPAHPPPRRDDPFLHPVCGWCTRLPGVRGGVGGSAGF